MTEDRDPPSPTSSRRTPSEREARLAQALRANLKRRKASPPAPETPGNGSSS
ncbi:MAG: hypothetical protein KJ676_02055 [Alphaproteobacteria bacterium]|nr:hypothetical protein [Alphaproteobacteria bacterium]MBU2118274.1 hypothetical protein [Alphaproteobacteria bacterium]MBU2352079.1 hypothetical protein [Alphaproteobacteria bacterium]